MVSTNLEHITINKLAGLLETSTHSLRYWEKQLVINVPRNSKKSRFYCENALKLFKKIRDLVRTGLKLKEVKTQLNREILSYNQTVLSYNQNEISKVEVIQNYKNDFNKTNRIELFLKPYAERINQLEDVNNKLIEENKILIAEKATLLERCSNMENNSNILLLAKEEIITSISSNNKEFEFKINNLNEKLLILEEKLNKKWWKFWK